MSAVTLTKIYPLADVLNMHLNFDQHNNKITGSVIRNIPVVGGLVLSPNTKIVASYHNSKEAGVLLHVYKDLYLLCQSMGPIGKIVQHIIDGSTIMLNFDIPSLDKLFDHIDNSADAHGLVLDGVVKTFVRETNTWSVLSNESNCDMDGGKTTGTKKSS